MLIAFLVCVALAWALIVVSRARMEGEADFWATAILAAAPFWLVGFYIYFAYFD